MTNIDQATFAQTLAEALMPAGASSYDVAAAPSARQVEDAQVIVSVLRNVLRFNPDLIAELGWQIISVTSPDDRLRRSFHVYAPGDK